MHENKETRRARYSNEIIALKTKLEKEIKESKYSMNQQYIKDIKLNIQKLYDKLRKIDNQLKIDGAQNENE